MPQAHLVDANGASIPAVGLGTFRLEGERCEHAVQAALAAGYRHIDTAKMYGNEEAVGAGLKASGVDRDAIFVTTKVWLDDIAPGDLERSAEASLKRLGLQEVDLLLIHWPNAAVPLERSTAALCGAKRSGLARHIGVSNYTAAMLDETVRRATEPLVTNQVEYHPYLAQDPVMAACSRHGLALTAYCPLGRGAVLEDEAVRRVAERHGKTPSQIVLRWHVQQPGVVAIPKSGTPKHIADNLDIFAFELAPDEMAALSGLRRPNSRVVDPDFAPDWDRAA
ncbi:aldo/keto reductase [Enterovirga sp.]|uniref:aldo/keto reductase n=1 Tax=Enterovirga sp. TaxID=2026350 RepID=UPI00260CC86A|nr:aldo/keto reductase [Enterovirga sp.]MDB5591442.1 2,5-didehydrogluconate reductase [Enterovirga sp.]